MSSVHLWSLKLGLAKLERGLGLDHAMELVSANGVSRLAGPGGVIKREDNTICPLVFQRLKIRLNIVFCLEELPLSMDAEVTHQLYCAASCPSTGNVQHCPWGWLFAGDHSRSPLCA